MKIKDLTKEELEAMSYDDIAFMILSEKKSKKKINDLFKEVCKVLNLPDSVFVEKLADFFEVLSTDQRFVMVKDGYWDLKERHTSSKIVIDDEEDEEDILADALEEDEEPEEDEEDLYYDSDETDDQSEDDLKDLVIVDDDEEANGLD